MTRRPSATAPPIAAINPRHEPNLDRSGTKLTLQNALNEAIQTRAKHRGLKVDIDRMRYFNARLYDVGAGDIARQTLYVGVGHGHDALLAIVDHQTERVIGVDPFISGHGNDDEDLRLLGEVVDDLNLADHFAIRRMFIQEYLDEPHDKVDRIVCNDVLHHIFETDERLANSAMFTDAVELFGRFRDAAADDGILIIADVGRHGLRQYVHGVSRPLGNYTRKQQWREWDTALREAGWQRNSVRNYVPYGLRAYENLLCGWLGRATICDKYFLTYRRQ